MSKPVEPIAIICLTGRGERANVAFRYDGKKYVDLYDPLLKQRRTETFRRYRVFIEVPWEYSNIKQIAVVGWPDDIVLIFDVPGLNEDQAAKWAQGIDIRDVAPPIATGVGNGNGDN
jgi:hypothetical protein